MASPEGLGLAHVRSAKLRLRATKKDEGIELGVTRIGVHSGSAIVGNFGGGSLFDYTAHGDAINAAARLESVNKILKTRICVSADTVEQIPDFSGRSVGILRLKGKRDGVHVFEPLSPEAAESPATICCARVIQGQVRPLPRSSASTATIPSRPSICRGYSLEKRVWRLFFGEVEGLDGRDVYSPLARWLATERQQ